MRTPARREGIHLTLSPVEWVRACIPGSEGASIEAPIRRGLLTTEKDTVKCEAFARKHRYALRVEAALALAFFDFILAKLYGLKTA